jgi:hypothetical protein
MDTYTIPAPDDESETTVFTKEDWVKHGRPKILILGEGWTEIGYSVFARQSQLLMIRIPASVFRIRANAFEMASRLHQIVFEEGSQLVEIETRAFAGASSLERINIPKNVEVIEFEAFHRATGLREVTFEDGSRLGHIGNHAFCEATALATIHIPKSVNKIEYGAFKKATSLKTFHIPKAVKVLHLETFMDSTSLREVTFDADSLLKTIKQGVFSGATALQTIHIPLGVTEIHNDAFANTPKLKELTFKRNSKIARISPKAFTGSGLTTVVTVEIVLDHLNAGRRAFNMQPLSFGKNNFYGKDNVSIVSRAQQINTLRMITKKPGHVESHSAKTRPSLPRDLTNLVGEFLTDIKPKSKHVIKKRSTRSKSPSKGGAKKTRKLR